ncbi:MULTISPECIES: bifunctional o-acetylhomoserine/o-acetylserine sulfhydrylase [Micrococcaceae]|uniref:bifunctional o-acetylhomoserine/o-acetylserine sulfhydrylase n=1 Tax=unclassified Kocuria TaxID=2649579 RepID=UPI001012C6C3|nr:MULTISPECIES: bifunctional o-acetylhomoserine/o-acetylserine sulfhydrylase [unclassified Kocuria]
MTTASHSLPTPSSPQGWKFETQQIHAGQEPDSATGARALPIYQTTSFVFDNAEQAANRFGLKELGPIYSRLTNPTQEVVENRIAALEGGVGALLVASGQAAITIAILNTAQAGDHIVASPSLYGGTYNLLKHTLGAYGIETTFVEDFDDPEAWRAAVKPNTKAFYGETVPNPRSDVFDIETLANLAHEVGVPLIVDNTVPTPYLVRPFEWGADVVVHSATKYLGGHGNSMGGVIVDSGRFDYSKYPERYPQFNTPDPSYHGLVFAEDLGPNGVFGVNLSYILRARVTLLRDLGSSISPTNAFNISVGLETLSLRVERHVDNALKVSRWLEARPEVTRVHYAGLESSQWYERGKKYAPNGVGAIVGFELEGGSEPAQAFVDSLVLHSNVANIGDVHSLVIHPASTTHSQLSEDELRAAGVAPGFVRLSVGLEHIDDIVADLEHGFDSLAAAESPQSSTETVSAKY